VSQDDLKVFWTGFLGFTNIFSVENKATILKAVDWETWMNVGGPSPVSAKTYFDYTTKASTDAYTLAEEYVNL